MSFTLDLLAQIQGELKLLDFIILFGYLIVLIGLGVVASRRIISSEMFMVAGRSVPGWAAGLSVMCAYTSSISYIATPGKAYNTNWNPVLFAYGMIPVALLVCAFIVPYYRKIRLISVYTFLEKRLGGWGRTYASLSFMLYMIGRIAVILYLACLLLSWFARPFDQAIFGLEQDTANIALLILIVGIITIAYTLLGGMEAIIWADVLQAVIMLSGIVFCAVYITYRIVTGPDPAIVTAWQEDKFNLGSLDASLTSRTILVMVIYSITENLRNLMADQNYVQKYISCSEEKEAKRSIWVATIIFVIMTTIFVYIGTALFAYYSKSPGVLAAEGVTKGDEVFPYFIATELITGLRGLLIAAIMAAAISTIATAFNCSATIWLQDFHKKFINPDMSDKASVITLRIVTMIWGVLGMAFALWMIKAKSALDVWWTMSGIFGGGILGLYLLSLMKVKLRVWQGIVAIAASILFIAWGTLVRESDPVGLMRFWPDKKVSRFESVSAKPPDPNSLRTWYKFDEEETADANVIDSSGNGNDAVVFVAEEQYDPQRDSGKKELSMYFGGKQGVMVLDPNEYEDSNIFEQQAKRITIAFWVKGYNNGPDREGLIFQTAISESRENVAAAFRVKSNLRTGDIALSAGQGERFRMSIPAPENWLDWNHYAIIKDEHENYMRVYLNGSLAVEKECTTNLLADIRSASIAMEAYDGDINSFIGWLDDFRIYSDSLSKNEVASVIGPRKDKMFECNFDPIIIGALGTGVLIAVSVLFGLTNRGKEVFVPADEQKNQVQNNE